MYNPPQHPSYAPTYGSKGYVDPLKADNEKRKMLCDNIMSKTKTVNKECYEEALNYISCISEAEKKMLSKKSELAQSIEILTESKAN